MLRTLRYSKEHTRTIFVATASCHSFCDLFGAHNSPSKTILIHSVCAAFLSSSACIFCTFKCRGTTWCLPYHLLPQTTMSSASVDKSLTERYSHDMGGDGSSSSFHTIEHHSSQAQNNGIPDLTGKIKINPNVFAYGFGDLYRGIWTLPDDSSVNVSFHPSFIDAVEHDEKIMNLMNMINSALLFLFTHCGTYFREYSRTLHQLPEFSCFICKYARPNFGSFPHFPALSLSIHRIDIVVNFRHARYQKWVLRCRQYDRHIS